MNIFDPEKYNNFNDEWSIFFLLKFDFWYSNSQSYDFLIILCESSLLFGSSLISSKSIWLLGDILSEANYKLSWVTVGDFGLVILI